MDFTAKRYYLLLLQLLCSDVLNSGELQQRPFFSANGKKINKYINERNMRVIKPRFFPPSPSAQTTLVSSYIIRVQQYIIYYLYARMYTLSIIFSRFLFFFFDSSVVRRRITKVSEKFKTYYYIRVIITTTTTT